MKLQTNIPFRKEKNQIDYQSKIVLLGSCFSENIGDKLAYFKFKLLQNPFGIIFNPVSSEKLLRRAIENNYFTEADIFEKNGQWHCLEVHSLVSGFSKEEYLTLLNSKLNDLFGAVQSASHLVLTYGTAWVYKYKASGAIVANCHKIPQKEFEKELLSVAKISEVIEKSTDLIRSVNPEVNIITTVSPVRHLKDGFTENARSKAHLLAALHRAIEDSGQSYYFPSYELMMDELRDYRFYEPDMIHPNGTAIAIIWDRFKSVWLDAETEALQKEIDTIQKGLQHRPFNETSPEHQKFRKQLKERIGELKKALPHIRFPAAL